MRERSRIIDDPNGLLASFARQAIAGEVVQREERKKDPHAVALGRRGGKKGGRARAARLSADERRDSARKAALTRWARIREKGEAEE